MSSFFDRFWVCLQEFILITAFCVGKMVLGALISHWLISREAMNPEVMYRYAAIESHFLEPYGNLITPAVSLCSLY